MKHMRVNDSDRELLELAAKAAGIDWWRVSEGFDNWNPLTDDGDALRLAGVLLLEIDMWPDCIVVKHSTGIKIIEAFNHAPPPCCNPSRHCASGG